MTQMAMTQNFVRVATEDTEWDYLEYKQFKEEKKIRAEEKEIDYFDCTIFQGYHGYTLACRTKSVYDLYRVYEEWQIVCESYKKFNTPSPLRSYWDVKLAELIRSQKLNENKLIMNDEELKQIVARFI